MWITEISELSKVKKSVDELWVRGGRIKGLEFLYDLPMLKRLFLSSIKTDDLMPIGSLRQLSKLELTNVGSGTNLEPISELENLEDLSLQTPPGWDGSNKTIKYKSLEPLTKLRNLKELTLLDVVFDFDGLRPTVRIGSLVRLTTRNKFTTAEFAALAKYKPNLDCEYAKPYRMWDGFEYYRCSKCGQMKVEFSGVDLKRRVFCLSCDKTKCDELMGRFNRIKKDV